MCGVVLVHELGQAKVRDHDAGVFRRVREQKVLGLPRCTKSARERGGGDGSSASTTTVSTDRAVQVSNLYLEVAVHNVEAVQVLGGLEDGLDEPACVLLGVVALGHDPLEELAAGGPV